MQSQTGTTLTSTKYRYYHYNNTILDSLAKQKSYSSLAKQGNYVACHLLEQTKIDLI